MDTPAHIVPVGPSGKLQNNAAMPYDFSIGSVIEESWKRVKGVKATYWGAALICSLLYIGVIAIGLLITYFYAGSLNPELAAVKTGGTITRIAAALVIIPLLFGMQLLGIRHSVNIPIKAGYIFEAFNRYWKILGILIVLYFIYFVFGFIVLFVIEFLSAIAIKANGIAPAWLHGVNILLGVAGGLAGIYLFFSLHYAALLMIEKKMGVFRAIKVSFLAFIQHGFKIIFTLLLVCALYLVSAIPFFIGLIWTLPMLYNCIGILYRIQFGVETDRS